MLLSAEYINWENRVCEAVQELEPINNSDAQSVMEAHEEYIMKAWRANLDPKETATNLLIISLA